MSGCIDEETGKVHLADAFLPSFFFFFFFFECFYNILSDFLNVTSSSSNKMFGYFWILNSNFDWFLYWRLVVRGNIQLYIKSISITWICLLIFYPQTYKCERLCLRLPDVNQGVPYFAYKTIFLLYSHSITFKAVVDEENPVNL